MNTSFFQHAKSIFKTIAMILSWTIFALLILIIGFLIYYLVCTNIYATKGEKYEPEFSLYTIVSPSMEPNIKVYDVILNTKVTDPSTIKIGDVITFISTSNISNGMTVTHRVVDIIQGENGLEFKTKGDNNLSPDSDTAKAYNLLGKVFLKIPQLGRVQFFLSSSGGWLLIVIFPALFIIVNDILKISKLNKAKKKLNEADNSEPNDEKIKLETFRKEEILTKLNKKDLAKAKEIENKLKSKQKEVADKISDLENESNEIIKNEETTPVKKVGFFARIIQAYTNPSEEITKTSEIIENNEESKTIDVEELTFDLEKAISIINKKRKLKNVIPKKKSIGAESIELNVRKVKLFEDNEIDPIIEEPVDAKINIEEPVEEKINVETPLTEKTSNEKVGFFKRIIQAYQNDSEPVVDNMVPENNNNIIENAVSEEMPIIEEISNKEKSRKTVKHSYNRKLKKLQKDGKNIFGENVEASDSLFKEPLINNNVFISRETSKEEVVTNPFEEFMQPLEEPPKPEIELPKLKK